MAQRNYQAEGRENLNPSNTSLTRVYRSTSTILNQAAREHPEWGERQRFAARSIYKKYKPTVADWNARLFEWNQMSGGNHAS